MAPGSSSGFGANLETISVDSVFMQHVTFKLFFVLKQKSSESAGQISIYVASCAKELSDHIAYSTNQHVLLQQQTVHFEISFKWLTAYTSNGSPVVCGSLLEIT